MSIPQYHIRNPQGLCNLTHGILTFIDHRIIKFAFFAFRKKMSPRTLYSLILIAAMSRNRGGNYQQHALIEGLCGIGQHSLARYERWRFGQDAALTSVLN